MQIEEAWGPFSEWVQRSADPRRTAGNEQKTSSQHEMEGDACPERSRRRRRRRRAAGSVKRRGGRTIAGLGSNPFYPDPTRATTARRLQGRGM